MHINDASGQCLLGSTKLNQLSQNCVERGVFWFTLPLQGWWWKLFNTDYHWGRNVDPSLWTADKKSVEWHHPPSPQNKFTSPAGKVMATVFQEAKVRTLVAIMPHSQIINSALYVQTLKTLQKHFRRAWPHKMQLKFSFNMTTHDHTHAWKQRKQSHTSNGLFLPSDHRPQILLPEISTSLEPSKTPTCGKGLGSDDKVTEEVKKWLWIQNSNWYKKRIDALVSRWHKTVELMEIT